jgi:hypothetical protein
LARITRSTFGPEAGEQGPVGLLDRIAAASYVVTIGALLLAWRHDRQRVW